MKSYLKDLKLEFNSYNKQAFLQDILSGATVAAVALPLALAFGVSSGASAASGLVTAIVAGFLISAFGGAYFQISGPTGAMAAILTGIVAQFGMQGVFMATLLAGVFLIIAGVFHMGRAISYIPMPVITGFTSGIALIIAFSQIDNFLIIKDDLGTGIFKLFSYFNGSCDLNFSAIFLGFGVVALMIFYPKKLSRFCPSSLAAIILASLIAVLFKLDVASVGEIPKSLFIDERLDFSSLHYSHLNDILLASFSIAVLAMVESLLCGASASRMSRANFKSDRELIAQGIGNIVVPFFGGIPATAAIARTSVAIKSGAKTRLAAMMHAVILLISMFLLAPIMSSIPLCVLSGVLLVTAFRMNDWEMIKYMFKRRFKGAIAKFLVTMFATIIFDLSIAILIGISLALVILLARISHIKIRFDSFDSDKLKNFNEPISKDFSQIQVIYIMGAVIFPNTEKILELSKYANTATIFSMRGTTYMDISGAGAFLQMLKDFRAKNIPIYIAGVNDDVKNMMKRSGIVDFVGENNFYWSVEMIAG